MEKQIKVNILGRDYSIKSDEEETYICEVADYVNRRIGALKDKGASNPISTLIYTAFNIADDYLKMKRKQDDFLSRIENKMIKLELAAEEQSKKPWQQVWMRPCMLQAYNGPDSIKGRCMVRRLGTDWWKERLVGQTFKGSYKIETRGPHPDLIRNVDGKIDNPSLKEEDKKNPFQTWGG